MQTQFRIQALKIQAALLCRPMNRRRAVHRKRCRTCLIVMRQFREYLARRTRLLCRARHDVALPVEGGEKDADERNEETRRERVF